MTDVHDRISDIEICVGARLPIRTERQFQRRRRGGGTESRIAVHMGSTEAGLSNYAQRIVFLQKQLPGGIKADGACRMAVSSTSTGWAVGSSSASTCAARASGFG